MMTKYMKIIDIEHARCQMLCPRPIVQIISDIHCYLSTAFLIAGVDVSY